LIDPFSNWEYNQSMISSRLSTKSVNRASALHVHDFVCATGGLNDDDGSAGAVIAATAYQHFASWSQPRILPTDFLLGCERVVQTGPTCRFAAERERPRASGLPMGQPAALKRRSGQHSLFDDLVGEQQERFRDSQAERLSRG